MGLFSGQKKRLGVKVISGFPNFDTNAVLEAKINDKENTIIFKERFSKTGDVVLPISKINDTEFETYYIDKGNKSGLGGAVIGGVLAGGAGAVVGAVSQKGKAKKKKPIKVYIISYDENKKLVMELIPGYLENLFDAIVREIAGLKSRRELLKEEKEAKSKDVIL